MPELPCIVCNQPVEYFPEFLPAGFVPKLTCELCAKLEEARKLAAEKQRKIDEKWNAICPPIFRNTILEQLPFPDRSKTILEFATKGNAIPGLNLWGWPDTGKTRTMYLVLHKLHEANRSILCFGAGDFGQELSRRDFKRAQWVAQLCRCDVLAFDDIDKINLTKEQELTFFAVLDKRMSEGLPCFFTHNSTAAELEYKFRNGKSVVRRIRHFTRSIHFPERREQQNLL